MAKKGSITVFLALVLSLMMSLVCTSIESVRMAAARTQILNSLDIGLYSLFGQYDKELLKDYDLFFLDGSSGGGTLKMAHVYDRMESYIKPVLRQNSQKLSLVQGGFTGYRLATDDNGEVFFHQAVQYMKDTLGSQGVQLLLNQVRKKKEQMDQAEEAGKRAEEGKALESYDTEMEAAAKNSSEAQKQSESQTPSAQGDAFGDESGSFTDGQKPAEVVNPITVIRRIRNMGILELVVPPGRSVSENTADLSLMVSGRRLQTGMEIPGNREKDTSYSSKLLFQEYLMKKLGSYEKPAAAGLKYQIEYLLHGKNSDRANLTAVARKLLMIREGVNFTHLLTDPLKRSQAEGLSLAIASAFLFPPAAIVIETALLLCWSFAESVLDVRELFDGGKVPLVKSAADWQLSLENLPYLLEGLDSSRRGTDHGMAYEDYLQAMLLAKDKSTVVQRGMDMTEFSIRSRKGRENFRLDSCIEGLEASIDVRANGKKVFTATKQYCYN